MERLFIRRKRDKADDGGYLMTNNDSIPSRGRKKCIIQLL
jgi:hypothetical protein